MKFEKLVAKNGVCTLKADGKFVYSKYKPIEDAMSFVMKEIKEDAEGYLLVGLGLGYHLLTLAKMAGEQKPIIVLCVDEQEIRLFEQSEVYNLLKDLPNISIYYKTSQVRFQPTFQVIIPNVWMQLMDKKHPLYYFLYDIKMKQVSYKRFKHLMEENFNLNISLNEFNLRLYKKNVSTEKKACLVASGPSLNETKMWLKEVRNSLYIICVGSALKVLLAEGIKPDAVIVTDAQLSTVQQLNNVDYKGYLFYLSTASNENVKQYTGERCILLQEGYVPAEVLAEKYSYPLLETGGSVATTAFSLLIYLGFYEIFLFGQDLGFTKEKTHAEYSTSGRNIEMRDDLIAIKSNSGETINTLPNLYSYLNWFEKKIRNTNVIVFNTALNGACIEGSKYLNDKEFQDYLEH
ncbi:MAG: 6-hydroxymethylpterin diphosphokinase MptE-like protein [Psychrobacillus psychrodurans]